MNTEHTTEPTTEHTAEPTAPSALPLRGVAMVLIAVAVALALWGLYAMTRSDVVQAGPQPVPASPTATIDPSTASADNEAQPSVEPASEPPVAERVIAVSVLNNSSQQGLAAQVAAQLRGQGEEIAEVGNLSEEILGATTVFYPAGDEQARLKAEELAQQFGAQVAENLPTLPAEATRDGAITVVLTG